MFKGLGKKLIITMCLFSVALSAATGFFGYGTYMDAVLTRYEDFAAAVLRLALTYIDADDMQNCFETGEKSAIYNETQASLNNIKETTGITFLYFFKPDNDQMVYYMNAFTQEEFEEEYINTLLDKDDIPYELARWFDALDGYGAIENNTLWGYMLSACETVRNSDGEIIGILGADVNMVEINTNLRTYIITVFIGAACILVVFTFLALLYMQKKITRPIQRLSEKSANFINHTNPNVALLPIINDIHTNDEIEVLSVSIEKMTTDLIAYLENKERMTRLRNVFNKYVDPKLVDILIESDEAEMDEVGKKKHIAVLFVDVRGFTPMSEAMRDTPETIVHTLNEYLELTSTAIFDNGGSVDKFVGDSTMALFNGFVPLEDYIYKAVKSAWDIVKGATKLNESIKEKYNVDIGFGVGVHCGEAIVGNLGPSFRKDYTAIGDMVNTAARIESNAGHEQVFVSRDVYEAVKDRVTAESIGAIPLKGKSIPLEVFSVTNVR